MFTTISLFASFASFVPNPTLAAVADAREVARINNCLPKKIEVYRQTLGLEGKTVYRIACNMPKTTDAEAAPTADSILVNCRGSLCELMRTIGREKN
jgi:hypothetical protein